MSKIDKMLEKEIKEAMKEVMEKEMQVCRPESMDLLRDLLGILAGNKPLTVDELSNLKTQADQLGIEMPELDKALSSLSEDKRNEAIRSLLSSTRSLSERMRICFEHNSTKKIERSVEKIEKAIEEIKKTLRKRD